MDKVHGGTPKGFSSICTTCRHAHIAKGMNLQQIVHCSFMGKSIGFPVETCTTYDDRRNPSLYQMEQIAWEIKSRIRAPLGFAHNPLTEITIEPPTNRPNTTTPAVGERFDEEKPE
jgi:hypothetical protein